MQAERTSRTQSERSASMQHRILEATVAVLNDRGYGGTTTLEVQQRAGVSRGALLHHFASRADLILAAIGFLTSERLAELVTLARSDPPAKGRVEWAVRAVWATFDGPLFAASLEVWLAARNDSELLREIIPQERVVGAAVRGVIGDLFGDEARRQPGFEDKVELLADAMRGAAARSVLRSPGTEDRLVARWVRLMHEPMA